MTTPRDAEHRRRARARARHLLLPAATWAAVLGIGAPAALTTYPGRHDGRLAFGMTVAGNVDVYSLRPDGSGLRRLTDAPGFDACPSYAPDGRSLVYCSGVNGEGLEIWSMRTDGSHKRQLTHGGGYATFPDISPDGRQVVFTDTVPTARNPDTPHLWLVPRCGGRARQLTTSATSDLYPAWSPDGRRIAFIRDGQVWTIRSNGTGARQLTTDAAVKGQLPDWSPDGRRIAYASGDDLWVMNRDGSGQHALVADPATVEFGPAWSPTGRQVAFISTPATGDRRVEVANADGSGRHQLGGVLGAQFVPAWQPRGGR